MAKVIDVPGQGHVEFPDSMSDAEIESAIQKNLAPPAAPSWGDTIAGLPITRLAMGAAAPLVGMAQAGAHIGDAINRATGVEPVVSPWIDKQLASYEAAKERGMKAAGNEGVDWMGLAGNLLPSASIATSVKTALPAATSVLGRAGVGAAQGGAIATSTPLTNTENGFWTTKGQQTALGAAAGGAMPLLMDAGKKVGQLVEQATQPLREKGRAQILREFQNALMGNNPTTKQNVIQALQNAQEIVPGSKPTAGEALAHIPQSTGLQAHQKDIAKLPVVSPDFAARAAEQEAARTNVVSQIAKTPADLEAAIQSRTTQAGQQYGDAYNVILNAKIPKSIAGNPYVKDALPDAVKLAQANGIDPNTNLTQFLHYVKLSLDKQLSRTGDTALSRTEQETVQQAKQHLVAWLEKKNPLYKVAREGFQHASDPINRMQVGQQLESTLRNPLDTSERATMFAKAVEEAPRTIKKATGQTMFDTLEQVLQPNEATGVRQVAAELARKDASNRLANQTAVAGKDAIPGDIGLPLPNLLWRPSMIANFVMKHFAKGAEDKIAKVAARQYLNPAELAQGLQDVPPRYRPMIEALMQQAPAAAATGTARQF